ncbi:MAG: hypothetical protein GY953_07080, partial [bacterium]|nr:hypothetical protein [bacterium]
FQPPFENGEAAVGVFGQSNFNVAGTGAGGNQLSGPRHISTDTDDRLYVSDTGNRRVQVFGRVVSAQPGANAVLTMSGLREPWGIFVSPVTGEVWVTDRNFSRRELLRYPKFDTLITQGVTPDLVVNLPLGLLAVQKDGAGNLYLADSFNRILVFFPGLGVTNAADFQQRVAPGMIASLFIPNTPSIVTKTFDELPEPLPLPLVLSDVEVLVDGKAVRIYFVSPTQINYLMANDAPSNAVVEIVVRRASTKQILATGRLRTQVASPAFFTRPPTGTGQIAALNQNNTINSTENRAMIGEVVQLFGTGAGHIPGAPPDGSAATGPVNTPRKPRVFVQGTEIPASDVQYSGLAPGLVGVWQLNIKIPDFVLTGDVFIVVIHEEVPNAAAVTVAVQRP